MVPYVDFLYVIAVFSSMGLCVCVYLTASNFSIRNRCDQANENHFILFSIYCRGEKSQCAMFMHIFGHKINVRFFFIILFIPI